MEKIILTGGRSEIFQSHLILHADIVLWGGKAPSDVIILLNFRKNFKFRTYINKES